MYYNCILVPQIIDPPDNPHTVTFTNSTSSIRLNCSLNVMIPSNVRIIWTYNGGQVDTNNVMQTDTTTTLLIRNLQPSDTGRYTCTFRFGGLNLRGDIELGEHF